MLAKHRITGVIAGLLALVLGAPAYGLDINKSVKIADGAETGNQSSVNGSISVGSDATVNGSLETVNGTIRVDDNTRIRDAETVNGGIRLGSGVTADDVSSVNGAIRLGENVTVGGEVSVVNGKITLNNGTTVARDVSNVNGEISLTAAEVGGDLSTVNGDVTLDEGSTLKGDLMVEKPGGWGWNDNRRKPRVIIGENSTVVGMIKVEREVELFLHDTAEVGGVMGKMSIDDAVRFSGRRP